MAYIYGSHDTMTYLKPKCFLGWFAMLFARCQKKTLQEQYDSGVRCFDVRITIKEGDIIFAHGILKFKGEGFNNVLTTISKFPEKCYIRLILEDTKVKKDNEAKFRLICSTIQDYYPNITFFGGNRRCDWKQIYIFKENPSLAQAVGSMAEDARWYEKLIPCCYANRMNKQNKEKDWKEEIVTFDFV